MDSGNFRNPAGSLISGALKVLFLLMPRIAGTFLASLLGLWLPVSSTVTSCRIQASIAPRIDGMATLGLLMRAKKALVDCGQLCNPFPPCFWGTNTKRSPRIYKLWTLGPKSAFRGQVGAFSSCHKWGPWNLERWLPWWQGGGPEPGVADTQTP